MKKKQSRSCTAAADGLQLTDVTVLTHPTGDALAEVPSNQVAAGVGVDTRLAITFVGIYESEGEGGVCGICKCGRQA